MALWRLKLAGAVLGGASCLIKEELFQDWLYGADVWRYGVRGWLVRD